ncbi:GNAT family N-acetyltransferase [Streptomonospora wellingtoniae]|uniref:GNAT family N-acetyltransferase n=1 Tax=Streptomonospora wellingtoniae TaxID=3075544 RepID=A0ABU2KWV6_9ACTN|nr:GNAT family N-acetyltransferase [Streptomonospora sp. DSM 45055]MDT0303786.1 GNAT family N-acetyltransferase [Streptomonospora sp. DSM 45055]
MRIEIIEMAWDDPAGVRLRRDQEAETVERYGGDLEQGEKPSAANTEVFLAAAESVGGEVVGCGGLRRLDEHTFELKRMYVVPAWRGRRIGAALLHALEDAARERGAVRIRLETGGRQPEAMRLYERCGYRRIPRYGPYAACPESVCYERALETAPRPASAPAEI